MYMKNYLNDVVIVIDPGHGGTNGGADDGGYNDNVMERFINIQTAKAMYDELSQYDNVKVYLTHDNPDIQMSLKQRAEFAKSVGADYLVSLHYNASESHAIYGSEVWIPSVGSYYVKGYQLADLVLEEFENMGLYNRGIKTRVGDDGDEYYGIIRENEKLDIPAIIIEHCHLDHVNDSEYCNEDADFELFGKSDATAVAKYFGLTSSKKGVDYSNYQNVAVEEPQERIYQDMTEPELCSVSLSEEVLGNGSLALSIEAADRDSGIYYYSYSLDGGNTYSELFVWKDEEQDGKVNIIISNIAADDAQIIVRVYNQYDKVTESEVLAVNGILQNADGQNESSDSLENEDAKKGENPENGSTLKGSNGLDNSSSVQQETQQSQSWYQDAKGVGIGIALILTGVCITLLLMKKLRKNRKY